MQATDKNLSLITCILQTYAEVKLSDKKFEGQNPDFLGAEPADGSVQLAYHIVLIQARIFPQIFILIGALRLQLTHRH